MRRSQLLAAVAGVLLCGSLVGGCPLLGEFLNSDFSQTVRGTEQVAILPGEAPGLLVAIENQTSRWVEVVVSARYDEGAVDNYTTYLAEGDRSAQLLVCPVTEITLGSVSDLTQAGARVALVDELPEGATVDTVPSIDVEPFGVLLKEGVNFDCGDSLEFVVRPSSRTRSGYETIVFFRRASN